MRVWYSYNNNYNHKAQQQPMHIKKINNNNNNNIHNNQKKFKVKKKKKKKFVSPSPLLVVLYMRQIILSPAYIGKSQSLRCPSVGPKVCKLPFFFALLGSSLPNSQLLLLETVPKMVRSKKT
jgi:hypothetical protein